jgi:hypothetical protein
VADCRAVTAAASLAILRFIALDERRIEAAMASQELVRFVMAKKAEEKAVPHGKARMRAEVVEAMRGLHKVGVVSEAELTKTTLRMLDPV